jgi:DHA1 family inner membrane transport protein
MGTAELVVVGILNLIAQDMGVSISTAGQLVIAYALGISIGGPILTALSIRFGRRFQLWMSLAIYIGGNVLAVVAVAFSMFIVARIVTDSIHGLFIGVALAVLGVPLGTLIGQAVGWQAAFIGIVILGVIALASTLVFVPSVEGRGTGGFAAHAPAAFAPRVLAMLGIGFLLMGGEFTAFTYLVSYLEEITGISGGLVTGFLLAFGIAAAVGTFLGGRAADHSATTTLVVCNVLLILTLGALYLVGSTPVLVALALAVWGLFGFGLAPSLQLRVLSISRAGFFFEEEENTSFGSAPHRTGDGAGCYRI